MEKRIRNVYAVLGLLLISNFVSAQQKIGHMNSVDIFSSLPEAKSAAATIESYVKVKQGEMDKMTNEFQAKLKVAQDKEKTLNEANKEKIIKELEVAQTELQNLSKNIETFREKLNKDISNKQVELFSPLEKKVSSTVALVAKEKGLSYIFDISKSQGFNNIAYFDGGEDVTDSIKSKLGITK